MAKKGNSHEFSKPQTIWKCSKLGLKGRVLTLSFNTRLKTLVGCEDSKVQNWSNKAPNVAWKCVNPSQIEISDYI